MEEQSAIKQLVSDINRLMESEEFARLEELAVQYKTALVDMDKAFRPHAEVIRQVLLTYQDNMAELAKVIQPYHTQLQKASVELSKVLIQLINELKKQPEADIEPLKTLQEEIEAKEPLDAMGQLMALSKEELSALVSFIGVCINVASEEQKSALWLLAIVLVFVFYLKEPECRK